MDERMEEPCSSSASCASSGSTSSSGFTAPTAASDSSAPLTVALPDGMPEDDGGVGYGTF